MANGASRRPTVGARAWSIPNPLHPDLISADERIAEIGQFLARGLVRLRARNASNLSTDRGESSVDFLPHRSGHADTPTRRQA